MVLLNAIFFYLIHCVFEFYYLSLLKQTTIMEIDISKMQQAKVDGVLYMRASEVCEKAGFKFRSIAHLKILGIPEDWILLANLGAHPKSKPLAYVTKEALIYLIITNPSKREENFEAGRVLSRWVVNKMSSEK